MCTILLLLHGAPLRLLLLRLAQLVEPELRAVGGALRRHRDRLDGGRLHGHERREVGEELAELLALVGDPLDRRVPLVAVICGMCKSS